MAAISKQTSVPADQLADQLAALKPALLARREQLATEVEDGEQRRANEDSFGSLAGEAADAGDASIATEQSDLRNAQIERDVAEMRDIDAALDRFEDGSYGPCVRCGRDIGVARLRPTRRPSGASSVRPHTSGNSPATRRLRYERCRAG